MSVTNNSLNESENPRFFLRADWVSFWVTFLVALAVYTLTLAPTVTLEDSGELIVAADYLGVPHPPGYPIWTVLAWFFQWVFHFVTYHGHPNPAWGVNFFSAFCGAASCGVLAMLVSASGRAILKSFDLCRDRLDETTRAHFAAIAGVSAGLLFAFTQCMWSQSVIAEVYSLNILFQSLILLLLYRWVCEPQKMKPFYVMAFLFGLGCTNHQTLMFMGLAMGVAVLFADLRLCRDFVVAAVLVVMMVIGQKLLAGTPDNPLLWVAGPDHPGFWLWTVYLLIVPLLCLLLPNGKKVCCSLLLVYLGLAFYGYMPVASEQNAPLNWGYAREWNGFIHAVTRGQYERVVLADVLSPRFLKQIGVFWLDLRAQFYWPIAVLAGVPLCFMPKLKKRENLWILVSVIAFVGVSLVFLVLQNPKMDIQSRFIGRVQYIQSHAIYSIWIGYGILLVMGALESLVKNNRLTKTVGVTLVALLPLALIYKNYTDSEQLRIVGGAELNGHDFGWQFGNWQLQGVDGIKADLLAKHGPEEFEKIWAAYPDPTYPPAMETNAIFFGGTDPGRFVPTYMIYSAKVRQDIYLITQNALADRTYMSTMRDMYGDQIWIPTAQDSDRSFREYIDAVRSGKVDAGAEIEVKDGKVSVQGVQGVMKINALLTEIIFNKNQFITEPETDEKTRPSAAAVVPAHAAHQRRAFYVEESYPMPWMYPYLTPHGLIMKVNSEKTAITPEMIKKDRAFWNWYVDYLSKDKRFAIDITARKTFSKLRNSLGGLYQARGLYGEAEYAFRQAIALYDLSSESAFRLAMLYKTQGRFAEAIELMQALVDKDELNDQVVGFLAGLKKEAALVSQLNKLEASRARGEKAALEQMLPIYAQLGRIKEAVQVAEQLLADPDMSLPNLVNLAGFFEQVGQLNDAETALRKVLARQPNYLDARISLAALLTRTNRGAEGLDELRRVIVAGGPSIRLKLQQDKRLAHLHNVPEFRNLVLTQASSPMTSFMK
jgi:tetratricopeptide (TPR) repeat protein